MSDLMMANRETDDFSRPCEDGQQRSELYHTASSSLTPPCSQCSSCPSVSPHFSTSNTATKVYVMRHQGCGFVPCKSLPPHFCKQWSRLFNHCSHGIKSGPSWNAHLKVSRPHHSAKMGWLAAGRFWLTQRQTTGTRTSGNVDTERG